MKKCIPLLFKLFILSCALSIYGCKVYDKQDVNNDKEVILTSKRIKVITIDDRRFFFDSLYYKEDVLYGHLLKSRQLQNTEIKLPKESIKEIKTYNSKKSIIRTVILFVCIGGIYAIAFAIN